MPFLQKKSVQLTFSSRRTANCKVPSRIGGHHFLLCQQTNTKDIAGQSATSPGNDDNGDDLPCILCTSIQIPPATLILNHRPKSCLKNERFLIFQISPNSRLSERKIPNDMLPLQIAHQILTHRHWGNFLSCFKIM